jgi:hypothetical protein
VLLAKIVLDKVKARSSDDEQVVAFQYMTRSKLGFVFITGTIPIGPNTNCLKYVSTGSCAFFTPDVYSDALNAKARLALPRMPQYRLQLILRKKGDDLAPIPPATVMPDNAEQGGGQEFVTPKPIFIWNRSRVPVRLN